MIPVDPSLVGSATDVATLFVVLAGYRRLRGRFETASAGIVATAREQDHVDDDRLQDDLGVEDSAVESVQTTIIEKRNGS